MSRISNLSNLRIPHFNSWKTIWYEKDKNYSLLFFRDFQIYQYLKGLFYRLKMLTDDFYFDNLISNFFFLKVNIYIYKFQIKKYFLSFFLDQFLLYNFFLKKRQYNFKYLSNTYSFYYFLSYIKNNNFIYYFFFSCYYFFFYSNLHFYLRDKKRKKFMSLNFFNNKRKFLINPIKLKLKKNNSFFFNFFRKKHLLFNNIKKYFIHFILKNILLFLFFFSDSFFLLFYYSLYIQKLKLLNSLFSYFINIKNKKNEFNIFFYLKENYRRELTRGVFDERIYYDFFFYFFLYSLVLNIEKSIYLFTGNNCIFFPVYYYYKKFPSFLSAKLVNDYVLLELEKGNNLFRIFKMLQLYQIKEKAKLKQELMVSFNKELFFSYFNRRKIKLRQMLSTNNKMNKESFNKNNFLYKLNKKLFFSYFLEIRKYFEDLYYNEILAKKYPLIGIRIECNGPPKRGRQARLIAYHQIVKNYKLFGKMPNKSILADIDYCQSFARTKQGSIGIKVWVFFYSKTYDSKYKLISII